MSLNTNTNANTNAGFIDDGMKTVREIERIQQDFGCAQDIAEMAYKGFSLYIPHLWVGTKTHPDGTLKGEGLVYGVMKNLGLGFLTKTTADKKAINITLRKGQNGKHDHQSCLIKFDRLFIRGEENAGNIAILEHLCNGTTNERTGQDLYNHLEVIYQEAGPNKYTGKDEPARFWKVFLWRHKPEKIDSVPSTDALPKVKFSLVKATDPSLSNSADPITKKVHFNVNSEDEFEEVGKGGAKAK